MEYRFFSPKGIKEILWMFCFLIVPIFNYAQKPLGINWPAFMKNQALQWDSISTNYYTGMILGNGLLGTNIYKEDDHAIRFDVSRTDVTDQRPHLDTAWTEQLYTHSRLPIGRMILQTIGKITGAQLQLDIYNAEASGTVTTTAGTIIFKSFVPSDHNVIYIEATGTGEEKSFNWKWIGENSISPRMSLSAYKTKVIDYKLNPSFQLTSSDGYNICYQPLLYRGEYATVWRSGKTRDKQTMVITCSYSPEKKDITIDEAKATLRDFARVKIATVVSQHQQWWHRYYQKSFISIPDKRMESFYWIQLYKLVSATRPGKPLIDLMGPWFNNHTPWPGVWWNLNIQLTYSPIFTANHLEIGQPLFSSLNNNIKNLIKNTPAEWQYNSAAIGRMSSYDLVSPIVPNHVSDTKFEAGNLTWALFYYYQYYTYSGDSRELRTRIFPLLKRSVNFMIHLLQKDENGIYHLPLSASPEYKNAVDANYSLSALQWGLQTLIKIDRTLGLNDAERQQWNEIAAHLALFPIDATGYMIGKNVDLATSHRHFSHLMMIYPFRIVNWDQPENHQVIERSIGHWMSLNKEWAGFSYPIASSMSSSIQRGDSAYHYLDTLLQKFVQPNTLYKEAGPVIETPLSAATAIQEMLLQSWGGKIRIFPAIPGLWKDVSIARLRTEGAFLISAMRRNGQTGFIKINSLNGGKCVLETDIPSNRLVLNSYSKNINVVSADDHKTLITWQAKPNQVLIIKNSLLKTSTIIEPVKAVKYKPNYWGLKKVAS